MGLFDGGKKSSAKKKAAARGKKGVPGSRKSTASVLDSATRAERSAESTDDIRKHKIYSTRLAPLDEETWQGIQGTECEIPSDSTGDPYGLGPDIQKNAAVVISASVAYLLIVDNEYTQKIVNHVQQKQRNMPAGYPKPYYAIQVRIATAEQIRTVYRKYRQQVKRDLAAGGAKSSGFSNEPTSEEQNDFTEVLERAAAMRASDIHIQLGLSQAKIEFRVNGAIELHQLIPPMVAKAMVNVAYLACDDGEGVQRVATEFQAGRISGIKQKIPDSLQAVRLQFNPLAADGEYAVLRLLYTESVEGAGSDIDDLGYGSWQMDAVRKMRRAPTGMVLISGVTGSGKSTTLQRSLVSLIEERQGTINVVTIENPPEYTIAGARQYPINQGETTDVSIEEGFARAIRAALRSDPDVIMIGEIRDKVSAELGIEAVRTGHQVWATLHAASCVSTLGRLHGFDIPIADLATTDMINGLIAQKLVPCLCPHCKLTWKDGLAKGAMASLFGVDAHLERCFRDIHQLEALEGKVFFRNDKIDHNGCGSPSCRRGYQGRTVVAEVMVPTDAFFEKYVGATTRGSVVAEKHWIEQERGILMREHCMIKVMSGIVDPVDMMNSVMDYQQLEGMSEKRLLEILHLVEEEDIFEEKLPAVEKKSLQDEQEGSLLEAHEAQAS